MTGFTFTLGGAPVQFRADDHFRADVDGVETWHPRVALTIWTDAELAARDIVKTEVPAPVPTAEDICRQIDAMRDARIAGGFTYMGHVFQSRATDRENISAIGADARDAIRDGAEAGDYLWHPDFPEGFGFINEANVTVPMDAFQTRGLRSRGIAFKGAQTFHARDLKDAVLVAADPSSVDWREGWPL